MTHEFKILARLLDRLEGEVEGHANPCPPCTDVQARLRAFANGALDDPERDRLVEELRHQPDWVAWLASEVKGRKDGHADPK